MTGVQKGVHYIWIDWIEMPASFSFRYKLTVWCLCYAEVHCHIHDMYMQLSTAYHLTSPQYWQTLCITPACIKPSCKACNQEHFLISAQVTQLSPYACLGSYKEGAIKCAAWLIKGYVRKHSIVIIHRVFTDHHYINNWVCNQHEILTFEEFLIKIYIEHFCYCS